MQLTQIFAIFVVAIASVAAAPGQPPKPPPPPPHPSVDQTVFYCFLLLYYVVLTQCLDHLQRGFEPVLLLSNRL
jgi:hypothetical protein